MLTALLAALFGASLQELSNWYQLRTRLPEDKFSKMITSTQYWVITLAMIIASPLGVILWFYDSINNLPLRDFVLFGAAFPLVFKSGVAAVVPKKRSGILGEKSASLANFDVLKTYLHLR